MHPSSVISLQTEVRNAESQAAFNYRKLDSYQSVGGLFWRSLSNAPPQTYYHAKSRLNSATFFNGFFFFCISTYTTAFLPLPLFLESRHQQ